MKQNQTPTTFLISRTDAIGDVVLTLPVAGWLKQHVPGARVLFVGRTYTAPVIAACPDVAAFINWDELKQLPETEQVKTLQQYRIDAAIHVFPNQALARVLKRAGVPLRIGTRNRWFHWFTCNRLVALSRRHSPLHESQLNLELLRPLGLSERPALAAMPSYLHLVPPAPLPERWQALLKPGVPRIILHPKSQGSAREWDLEKYGLLARRLHELGYQVLVSGTASEQALMQDWLAAHRAWVTDVTGKLNLAEFIQLISACDGLVAASTGPLHLAAALGVHALGLFPPIRPIHPGRWAPVGEKAEYLVLEKDCSACRKDPRACSCISQLSVGAVLHRIQSWGR